LGFIERFLKKEPNEVNNRDVEQFIQHRIEENLNLDYTHIETYHSFEELAKDVSAFANSEGGLIVLGVSEERIDDQKIFPKEITWGDKSLTKERLEDNLIAKVHPTIDGLRILPVRKSNGSGLVMFLIDIPQGLNPPYMASEKKYYKRLNFRKYAMEHYEVADLFGRRRKPLLTLTSKLESIDVKDNQFVCTLRLLLANRGRALAKYVRFIGSFDNAEVLSQSDKLARIDDLRKGVPSIQFSPSFGVLHPHPSSYTNIGEITLKTRTKDALQSVKMTYELEAEDMFPIQGELSFNCSILTMAIQKLQAGEDFLLSTQERSLVF
jgi:hypothetical protein